MINKFLAVSLLTIVIFSSNCATAKIEDKPSAQDNKEIYKMLELFGDVFERVRSEYVEEKDSDELIESAINGMLNSLDPHSGYMAKKAFDEMQVHTSGEFGGLGIEVTMRMGMVYVVAPIDDTPAYEAGVEAGDFISHINDESVQGMDLNEAVKKMRGKPKTEIKLTILRKGKTEPFDLVFDRDIITIKSVKSSVEGDVGYIRVSSFSQQADKGIKKKVKEIKKEIGKEFKGLVLDLRNNPGGLLNQAVAVADIFLEQGQIVSTRGRDNKDSFSFSAKKGDVIDGLPLVILINGGSASASEIVSGALQDHKRAVVIGTKSFGKGSVQTVMPIPNGGAIKMTTSRYYTPSGKSIQAEGIVPDIEVQRAKLELIASPFATSEADLRGHLDKDKDGKKKEKTKKEKEKERKKAKETAEKILNGDEDEDDKTLYERDYQLGRAIDLVKALYITQDID